MQDDFILTRWVFQALRWVFEDVTHGHIVLTVLIFTVVMRGLTIIGDIKSRQSSAKMQEVQPDLQKLQKKYANNPQKLQQAQSKLMRERGVSMWGGCLPMLITMPLFFIFLAAFRQWGYEQMCKVIVEMEQTGASPLFGTFEFMWIHNIWQPDNGMKPVVMAAEEFLKIPDLNRLMYFAENPEARVIFERLGFFVEDAKNIPQAAIDNYTTLMKPIADQYEGYNNGWFILPVLAAGTTFLSSWIMQKGQKQPEPAKKDGKEDAAAAAGNSMKAMMYVMPAMSFIFLLNYNATFGIYWTFSNLFSLITNLLLNRKFKKDKEIALAEEGKK